MTVTFAIREEDWIETGQIWAAPVPTGTGGVLVLFIGGADSGQGVTPQTPADWTQLGTKIGTINMVQVYVTDVTSPNMNFVADLYGTYAFGVYRVSDGTLTGILSNGHQNGDWGTATLAAPTVASAPANSVGLCCGYTDQGTVQTNMFTWNNASMVEDHDSASGQVNPWSIAHQEALPAGTWDPGTVTFSANTVVTWKSVVVPTSGGAPPPATGKFRAWTGTEWKGTAKVWTGSEWKTGAKIWTGSEWKAV